MQAARTPLRRAQVREQIERMIEADDLWGRRLPPYRKLAREIGVSGRTLQLTLAEMEAEGIVESRHGSGTYVLDRKQRERRAKLGRLAVIVRSFQRDSSGWGYKDDMVRGVVGKVKRMGGSSEVLSLHESDQLLRIKSSRYMRDFDGFVLIGISEHELLNHLLKLKRGPVVVVDRGVRSMPVVNINDDSFSGARSVARHLLSLGHRRIGFIDLYDSEDRNAAKIGGYRTALAERGVEFDRELVAAPEVREAPGLVGLEPFVESAVDQFLGLKDPATAIFAFNDRRALMAMAALEKRGLGVGKDISLAGFGDRAFRSGACDWMTSCRIYPYKMGQEAARAALESRSEREGREIMVPTRLMARKSTCPPANRK
ncbi:MAG: substrate-binding domain-containing protein [Planctomycetota bacterium]|jgi:LacI family transcriptional regulator